MAKTTTAEQVIDEMISGWKGVDVTVTDRAREKAIEYKKDISLARPSHNVIGHRAVTRSLPTLKHLS